MRVTYFGHSCFLVETTKARLVLDPFFTGNPVCPVEAANVSCDYVLVSHGHSDHTGDALALALRCGATLIANHEIAEYFGAKGAPSHGLNPGGGFNFPFGRVKLTPARHSSSLDENPLAPVYMGEACGLLITTDGRNLYHAGDTALFLDMQLIGRAGLDLALLPIGDNYTMGPDDALAALDLLRPKLTVPMHYNTWPVIAQNPEDFAQRAQDRGHTVRPLKPGASLEI
jgi:L-ascorbate metabolism protein UlaG (beta-lactamase superfamily)